MTWKVKLKGYKLRNTYAENRSGKTLILTHTNQLRHWNKIDGMQIFFNELNFQKCESYSGCYVSFLIYESQYSSESATRLKRFTTTIWEGAGWNNEKALAVLLTAAESERDGSTGVNIAFQHIYEHLTNLKSSVTGMDHDKNLKMTAPW